MLKRASEMPQTFDERAKDNIEAITKIHEFRRSNINEIDVNDTKDYFDYD
jgi:hypothetical protein